MIFDPSTGKMRFSSLDQCLGSGTWAARSTGAHWTNHAKCKVCGKQVQVTRRETLRAHGTKRKS